MAEHVNEVDSLRWIGGVAERVGRIDGEAGLTRGNVFDVGGDLDVVARDDVRGRGGPQIQRHRRRLAQLEGQDLRDAGGVQVEACFLNRHEAGDHGAVAAVIYQREEVVQRTRHSGEPVKIMGRGGQAYKERCQIIISVDATAVVRVELPVDDGQPVNGAVVGAGDHAILVYVNLAIDDIAVIDDAVVGSVHDAVTVHVYFAVDERAVVGIVVDGQLDIADRFAGIRGLDAVGVGRGEIACRQIRQVATG